MKIMAILIAVVALVSGANALDNASNSTAATMAVADPSRPDSDTTRDADRKPAQTLVFVGIKSGDKVADYVADAGYFTRPLCQRRRLDGSRLRGGAHRLLQVRAFR